MNCRIIIPEDWKRAELMYQVGEQQSSGDSALMVFKKNIKEV